MKKASQAAKRLDSPVRSNWKEGHPRQACQTQPAPQDAYKYLQKSSKYNFTHFPNPPNFLKEFLGKCPFNFQLEFKTFLRIF